jgi:predicted methyltransferase
MVPRKVLHQFLLVLLVGVGDQTADQKRDADDAAKLIEVLNLRPGSTVADIGAGGGALEPAISRAIGRVTRSVTPRG